ncbi:MAG: Spy/CpxP family protein refolding chaperone [Gammaproteobacteria bacterium]|nr:Spy/CpxP family protein refolding chaperone [Gammaproteobacteria bacterium]
MTQFKTTCLLLIIALTSSVSVFANQFDDDRQPKGKQMLQKMEQMLDLSSDQVTAIKQIFQSSKQTAQSDKAKLKQLQKNIKQQMDQSSVDEQSIRKLAHQAADTRVNLMLLKHASEQKIKSVLNAEQQAKFELIKEMRADKRQQRRNRQQ